MRTELQIRRERRDAAQAKLREENAKFERFVDKLTQVDSIDL